MDIIATTFYRYVSILLFSVLLTACSGPLPSSTITAQNLERINEDMSPAQVKSILGEPQEATSAPIPVVGGTVTTYHYRDNAGSTITIIFKNGLMKKKDGSFNNK